jgi:hypothetical protein
MASERSGLLSEGALYESISRGNKDNYFLGNKLNECVNPFEYRYSRRPATVSELRLTIPLNAPDFARTCEFEFDIAGDVFTDTTLLIDLPTWLPPTEAALNTQSGYSIVAASGRSYGYTRGAGYFLFSAIQLFQDKVLLQEFSGDALWGSRLTRGTLNSAYLDQALTGMTGAPLSRQATPGRLRLRLPMLGAKTGVPSIGMRQQTFRLRLTMRPLEECIECSDDSVFYPTPWKETAFVVTGPSGTYSVAPLPREAIQRPTLTLETRHVYVDYESRDTLQKMPHEIPYALLYENNFTFGGLDYKGITPATYPSFTRLLDAEHSASRMFWFLRTKDDLMRGRRWSTSVATPIDTNPYYQSLSLVIAARDRESLQVPLIWNTLTPYAKEERSPGYTLGIMNWDLGAVPGQEPLYTPEGTINFSTAEKPVILIYLRGPTQPLVKSDVVEMTLVIESWSLYIIEDGRGFMKYSN